MLGLGYDLGFWLEYGLRLVTILINTSLNPQSLRDIIKKVAKISINQILIKLFVLMSNLSIKTTVFCYFFCSFLDIPQILRVYAGSS